MFSLELESDGEAKEMLIAELWELGSTGIVEEDLPAGRCLLRAFFGGAAAERMMRCGNDEVASIARLELARILGPMPDPQITIVRRWPRSRRIGAGSS